MSLWLSDTRIAIVINLSIKTLSVFRLPTSTVKRSAVLCLGRWGERRKSCERRNDIALKAIARHSRLTRDRGARRATMRVGADACTGIGGYDIYLAEIQRRYFDRDPTRIYFCYLRRGH